MMKIRENTVEATYAHLKEELQHLYFEGELKSILERLFEAYLGFSKIDFILKKHQRLSESELLKFVFAKKDLRTFKPVQYIIGYTYFFDCKLLVNENVLIPRPETEELVQHVVHSVSTEKSTILEVGTGSGCIAIALKKQLNSASILTVDVSEKALELAQKNAQINEVAINFQQADFLDESLWDNLPQFDRIVSNPPYIGHSEQANMHANVLNHEPHLALFVPDNDLMLFYRAILKFGWTHLTSSGEIFCEINQYTSNQLHALAEEMHYFCEIFNDLNDNPRVVRFIPKKEVFQNR